MPGSGSQARRRRIIEGGQDRLALITGRKPSNEPGSSPPFVPSSDHDHDHHLPSVSQNEEDNSSYFMSSMDYPATNLNQDDVLGDQIIEEPVLRKFEHIRNEHFRAPAPEDRRRAEPPSAVQKTAVAASDVVLRLAKHIPICNVSSQQLTVAVAVTELERMLCALTMAILVVLSYSGFPLVSSRYLRSIILFRPLFLLLITNITLVVRRIRPHNPKNSVRGDKDKNDASLLGDGLGWAEDAGRALEVGLMLQSVTGALFMDCSVYATVVVFGLSLFG